MDTVKSSQQKHQTEILITFVSCLLSHPSSLGSFSSSIYFLRKQHYMHPSNKLPVLCFNRLWRWTNIISLIYGVMAILCSELITIVIKYKLKIRNRLWNTGAGIQESLQNSSLGKISVSFRVKEEWKYCLSYRGKCICFVFKWAYEMLKLLHNRM